MARIRTVKPEMWSHPKIAAVSRDARLTFVGLLNQADDAGRCELIPRLLLGAIFPYDDDVHEDDVLAWVSELSREGLVRVYEHRQRRYLCFPGWEEHQRVDNPSKARCPDPDAPESEPVTCGYDESRETVASDSRDPIDRNVGAWERRSVGSESVDDAAGSADDAAESFEDFWQRYPRHHQSGKPGGGGSRKKALDRWRKLKATQRELALAAVDNYRAWCERSDGEFAAHATTWLNEARWEQWQEPAPSANGRPPPGREHEALDRYDPAVWTARPSA